MLEESKAGRGRVAFIAVLVIVGLAAISLAAIVATQPAWMGVDSRKASTAAGNSSRVPSVLSPPVASAAPTAVRPTFSPSAKPGLDPALSAEISIAQRVVSKYWSRHWSEYFPGSYVSPKIVGTY